MEAWMGELRLAVRRFRTRPGRALVGVLTLALGIAASTASYSVVQAVLLEPLPVESQEELVVLWQRSRARDFDHVPFLPAGLEAVSATEGIFRDVAAFETVGARPALAEGPDGTFAIDHVRVGGDFFGVLGTRPALGRLLEGDDDRVGAAPTAVISHDYWIQAEGGDPNVLGSTLRYDGISYTVVGVAPPGFDVPRGTDVWATLRGSFPEWGVEPPIGIELDLVGRLADGMTLESASVALDRLLYDDPYLRPVRGDLEVVGVAFEELVVGSLDSVLKTALAAALVLLTVAIANATLLLLAGGSRIVREMALRRALGASGRRAMNPLMADAALQAVLAVVLGVALARLAIGGLIPLAPEEFARFDEVLLDGRAVAFAAVLGVVAMLGSAALAGVWLARGEPRDMLVAGARTTRGGQSLRPTIAGAQVAFAVLTAVGAALLHQTVANLDALDRGFEADGLYVVTLNLPFSFFEPPDGYRTALEEVSAGLAARPGIVAASPTINAPLSVRGGIDFVPMLEGQSQEDARSNPFIGFDAVSPQYFDVAGTRVLEGRGLGPEDGSDDAPTLVVNEAAARLLWPGESAIGQRVFMGGLSRAEWRTVVGIVENHRFRSFPEVRPAAYLPLAQFERFAPSRLVVRAIPGTGSVRALVRAEFASAYPGVDVLTVESMSDVVRRPLLRPRFAASVLLSFASVTLLLAALGIHGVFSVLVQERTWELGVRKALGAEAWDLFNFVAARVVTVGGVGATVGALLSIWASGLIESLFYGVSAGDPRTVASVLVGVVVFGMAAAAVPTLQAVRTDPVECLRPD
jgi:putative ABC transport system permease protein